MNYSRSWIIWSFFRISWSLKFCDHLLLGVNPAFSANISNAKSFKIIYLNIFLTYLFRVTFLQVKIKHSSGIKNFNQTQNKESISQMRMQKTWLIKGQTKVVIVRYAINGSDGCKAHSTMRQFCSSELTIINRSSWNGCLITFREDCEQLHAWILWDDYLGSWWSQLLRDNVRC